jgi:SSS family solute:Na+ symporter
MRLVASNVTKVTGQHSFDEVLPLMLIRYCGPGMLGLGITAQVACFKSGMAGQRQRLLPVWTYDIYGAFLSKKRQRQALRRHCRGRLNRSEIEVPVEFDLI